MKKRIAMISMALVALFATGCNFSGTSSESSESSSGIEQPTTLAKPSGLTFTDRTLTWMEVEGADGYTVEVNGTEYEVTTTSYTLADGLYGTVKMRVKATNTVAESAYSDMITEAAAWKLPTPQGLVQDENFIRWEAVNGAQGYVININGIQYFTNDNYYAFEAKQPTVVKVLACGNTDGTLVSSEYTTGLTVKALLAAPEVRVNGTGVTWSTVANASGYEVYVNNEKFTETTETTCDFRYLYVGQLEISVKALSANDGYLSSAKSTVALTLVKETLSVPVNVRFEDETTLIWEEVLGATGYTVFNNGEVYATVTENRFEIPNALKEAQVSQIQIRADAELHYSSGLSEVIDVGQVSEASPLEIKTAADFNAITVNGHYKLMNDIEVTTSMVQTFKGTLNGNGCKITGLTGALFGVLDGAKVKDITIENAAVNSTVNEYGAAVGVLANKAVGATLENCMVKGTLTVVSQNGVAYAGGIVGISENTDMKNVSFQGNIETSYCTTGGLVGWANEPVSMCEFVNCSVVGKIEVVGGQMTEVGGLIGKLTDNMLTIRESNAEVEITTNASYCGGFVGYMGTGKIVDCYVLGSIDNTHATMAHVGGFIGRLEGYNNKVSGCISRMEISAQEGAQIKVGGFVGTTVTGTYGKIYEDCLYDGTLANIDRVGFGVGDGISKKTTEELQAIM